MGVFACSIWKLPAKWSSRCKGSLDVLQSGHHPHRPRSHQLPAKWSSCCKDHLVCFNLVTILTGQGHVNRVFDLSLFFKCTVATALKIVPQQAQAEIYSHIDENCIISLKISPPSHFTVLWKFYHLHSRICNEKLEIKMMPNIKVKVASHSLTETY